MLPIRNLCVLLAVIIVFSGCDTDKSNANAEQSMFLETPPPANFVISSPLQGILLKDGIPLSHARILRKLRWNGNEAGVVQEFHSDETGFFSLPAHEEILSIGALEQFVGKTNIDVEHEGKVQNFWFSAKTKPDLNSEYDTPPSGLTCDLSNAETGVEIRFGTCLTRCRWDNMPVPGDPYEP